MKPLFVTKPGREGLRVAAAIVTVGVALGMFPLAILTGVFVGLVRVVEEVALAVKDLVETVRDFYRDLVD